MNTHKKQTAQKQIGPRQVVKSVSKLAVKARPGSRFSTKDIKEAWEILTEMAGGPSWPQALTPKMVLDAVLADPDHPLRRHLELDVDRAAYQFWLGQIRYLMTEVRVSVIHDRPLPRECFARVLHPMPAEKGSEGGFRPINVIRKEEKLIGVLARSRVTYLKQWAASTENTIAAIESPSELHTLETLLFTVQKAIASFESQMRVIEDAAE